MSRRSYPGAAVATTLASPITAASASLIVDAAVGYPDPATEGPFAIRIAQGTPNEEKILVGSRSGSTFSDLTRGYDDTTATSHSAGDSVGACYTATDADEANAHVHTSTGVHGLAPGDRVVGESRAQTLTGKSISGLDNSITDLPQSAIEDLDTDLAALSGAISSQGGAIAGNTAAIGDRYTKAEIDGKLNGPLTPSSLSATGNLAGQGLSLTGDASIDGALTVAGKVMRPSAFTPVSTGKNTATNASLAGAIVMSLNVTADYACKARVTFKVPWMQTSSGIVAGDVLTTYLQVNSGSIQDGFNFYAPDAGSHYYTGFTFVGIVDLAAGGQTVNVVGSTPAAGTFGYYANLTTPMKLIIEPLS